MRCPYPDCQKDYNQADWEDVYRDYVNPHDYSGTPAETHRLNRVHIISRNCRFCHQYFHEIFVGHPNPKSWNDTTMVWEAVPPTLELVATYPAAKTSFKSRAVPKDIREAFHEAERCRSIGAMTGVAACLRKTVYAVCDNLGVSGTDYREKISNLPLSGEVYKELLKQIKFIGDNGTKPGGDTYSPEQVDSALTVLPVVIDKLYEQDEKIEEAQKALAAARSKAVKK